MKPKANFLKSEGFREQLCPWFALISIGIGWGATGPLSKVAMSTGYHPIGVAFCNIALGTFVTTSVLLISRNQLPLSWRHLVFYLCCGLIGRAVPSTLNFAAFAILPVGVVVLIIATTPMVTFLIAMTLRIEKASYRRLCGLAMGATAILLIVLPGTSIPSAQQAIWIVLPMIVSICYAVESIIIAIAKPTDCTPLTMMCGITWGALFALAPTVASLNVLPDIQRIGLPELAIVAGSMLHLGSYFGFVWLIGKAGPVFAAQVGYVVTGSGVILGILIFGERHSAWEWMALALMLTGLFLVKPRQ